MNLIPKSLAALCMNEQQVRMVHMPKEVQDLIRHFRKYAELGFSAGYDPCWGPFQYEDYPMIYGTYRVDCSKISFWESVRYLWSRIR